MTFAPLTIGLNGHVIRTRTLDWSIGAVGGAIWFGDLKIESQTTASIR